MNKKKDIINFYTNVYDEAKRLGEGCDNRHLIEKTIKLKIYEDNLVDGSICDIGAGMGLYSLYFAKKGYKVKAFDVVPKHVEYINLRAKTDNLPNLSAELIDISDINFENNNKEYYKNVFLAGPIYHLSTYKEKKQALLNVSKLINEEDSRVFVDWLSINNAYANKIIGTSFNCYTKCYLEDGCLKNDPDDIFSYDDIASITKLAQETCYRTLGHYSLDGLSRLFESQINIMSEEQLKLWIEFIECQNNNYNNLADFSEHSLTILT